MSIFIKESNLIKQLKNSFDGKDGKVPEITLNTIQSDSPEEISLTQGGTRENIELNLTLPRVESTELDRTDYMGNTYNSLRETLDANVDYVLGEVNRVSYEGTNIIAEDTIEGRCRNAVLKGRTLVNYNKESYDRNEYVCIPSVEGQNVTVNDTVEGKVKNAILKGQTLVNLFKKSRIFKEMFPNLTSASFTTLNGEEVLKIWGNNQNKIKLMNTPKTAFTIKMRCSLTSEQFSALQIVTFFKDGSSVLSERKLTTSIDKLTDVVFSYSGVKEIDYISLDTSGSFAAYVDVNSLTIVEGDYTNVDIPYFEGMSSVKSPVLKMKNKINADDTELMGISNGGASILTQNGTNLYLRVPNRWGRVIFNFDYEASKTYNLSFDAEFDTPDTSNWCIDFNQDGGNRTFFSSNNSHFSKDFKPTGENLIQICNIAGSNGCTLKNFVISEVSIKDEPYKSSTLTTPQDIVLRGIGDVKDELDLVTGELTERISEIVLDGTTDNLSWFRDAGTTHTAYWINFDKPLKSTNKDSVVCDKLPAIASGWTQETNSVSIYSTTQGFITIAKEELDYDYQNTNAIIKYLLQNPITIQYQLATPIIKTIDLNSQKVYSYNDTTHYTCSSAEGSLIPTLSIEEGVKYQSIIKPSTKYSIIFNRTVASDSLTVDLGGATANVSSTTTGKTIVQITTPTTLSHNYVKFLGVGNVIKDVQVIEGDVADDIEYFEGMIDVENPIVINCNSPIIFGKGGRL